MSNLAKTNETLKSISPKSWKLIGGFTLLIGGFMIVAGIMKFKISNLIDLLPKGTGEYRKRILSVIEGVIVHHAAADNRTARDYALTHINQHNWPGIGYHFEIAPDGTISQTNTLDKVSYHAGKVNSKTVGIVMSGNFSKRKPSKAQINSLVNLVRELETTLNKKLWVKGHGEVQATKCPGKYTDMNQIRSLI